jgi:hypothetical protein
MKQRRQSAKDFNPEKFLGQDLKKKPKINPLLLPRIKTKPKP